MKKQVFLISTKSKIRKAGFLILLGILLIEAMPVKSSNLYVYMANNSVQDAIYPLNALQRLTFSETKMIGLSVNGRTEFQIDYSALRFFSLKGLNTAIASNPGSSATITINPNPTLTNVIVTSINVITNISLYDMQGQQLLQFHPESTEANISLLSYPVGVYLLQITNESGITTKKLIKK